MPIATRQAARMISLLILLTVSQSPVAHAQSQGNTYINPPGLVAPTGYTHVVVAADRRTVYIAGQVAFDSTGKVVGNDFRAQAEQVYGNLRRALASVGASFADLVKTTTLVTDVRMSRRSARFGTVISIPNILPPTR
jgi:enamine deaminase RidA (YjgF/YER057c/UK114 family)